MASSPAPLPGPGADEPDAEVNGEPAGGASARRHRARAVARSLRSLVAAIAHKCGGDRIFGMSAEAGFWGLISLPSLLLAVFGAIGYLGGVIGASDVERIRVDVLRVAGTVLSSATVSSDVAPIVDQILKRGHAGLLSISFVISLWSGSSAMAAYVNTITVAYGMRGVRSAVRSRIIALELYLGAVVAGAVLLPAGILGPDAMVDLSGGSATRVGARVVSAAYWPGLLVLAVVSVTTLYRLSLPERVRWARQLPGGVLAVGIWLAGSLLLRTYLAEKVHADTFYGALAAPLAALLFFYITALAVLLGAELNAARYLRQRTHRGPADGAIQPLTPPE
jgi:membrane protein